ncbi:dTDP-glucose 4,6-dehydratase [Corynebacterium jeikeium]|uniref:dTDP-glucose 4,6-dehydratase n=1 Tax=Corynebacterium jeikeium TaxID=38289 RepID=UPI00088698FF|nr:dTDP-glucose 4,6-dehydratase [Corynebacterium jeikeium]SCX23684.1 dTDP-glucose 4,6-dehydratase [Corynebacterium jeikeium]
MPEANFSTVLVTGGAGFIGANFVHRTLETRPDVKVLIYDALTYAANPLNLRTDDGTPLEEAYPGRVEFIEGDVADASAFRKALERAITVTEQPASPQGTQQSAADRVAIVHFAAESHNDNSLATPAIFARSNVEGTLNVAQAATDLGVRLHHISTDEVFGDLALDDPNRFTVDTPYNPSSPYSASKAAADHFVRAFVRSRGLKATISNCSNNYGPRQHPEKFIPRQITGLIEGHRPRLYGSGENVRDWIHVDDHNDAVWAILDSGKLGETYLIGAEGERSNLQVVRDLLELFGRPADDFVHVTDRPGHDRRYAIDPSSIAELGWQPRFTDFASGLAETVEWYRRNEKWWVESRAASEKKYSATEQEITAEEIDPS